MIPPGRIKSIIVCEADLEILMLCVRPLVRSNVENSDQMTEWQSDQVTKWPSDQVTEWQEVSQTIDSMVYLPQDGLTTYIHW